jgi:capsid protein
MIQEEFDRHVGYWWQPQTDKGTYCILVEMTDERYVDIIRTLDVSANDCECHRYPRPGTPNAAQSVALVEFSLDEAHQTFTSVIKYLAINLKILFPWMEYVV